MADERANQDRLREAASRVIQHVNIEIDQFTRDVRLLASTTLAAAPEVVGAGLREDWRKAILDLSWIPLNYRHDVIRNIEAAQRADAPGGDTGTQQGLRSGHPFNSGYGPSLSVHAADAPVPAFRLPDSGRLPQQEAVMDDWTNHHNHVKPRDECHLCIEEQFGPVVARTMQRFWNRKREIDARANAPVLAHPDFDVIVKAHMKLRRSVLILAETCEPDMAKKLRKLLNDTDKEVYACGCPVEDVNQKFAHRPDCMYGNFGKALAVLPDAPVQAGAQPDKEKP